MSIHPLSHHYYAFRFTSNLPSGPKIRRNCCRRPKHVQPARKMSALGRHILTGIMQSVFTMLTRHRYGHLFDRRSGNIMTLEKSFISEECEIQYQNIHEWPSNLPDFVLQSTSEVFDPPINFKRSRSRCDDFCFIQHVNTYL